MKILRTFSMVLVILTLAYGANAQKDSTEITVGKRKIVIIDTRNVKERAVSNLEEGIVRFQSEIDKAEERIDKLENDIDKLDENSDDYDTQVKVKEAEIAEQEKKIAALEKGIAEIEDGIEELENQIDTELNKLSNIKDDLNIEFETEGNEDYETEHKELSDEKYNRKEYNAHWAGIEFGFANFMNNGHDLLSTPEVEDFGIATDAQTDFMQLKAERSFATNINFMEYNIPISRYYFGITTGLSANFSSYSLEQNVDLIEDANGVIQGIQIPETERDYTKNKLNTTYFTIPLLAELQIPLGKHRFYLQAGATGSVRAWSKQKQIYYIDGEKYKNKFVNDYQLSPFRYGATVRFGYGPLGIFVNYSMVSLFKEDCGPELYPIEIGMRILNF